MEGQQAGGAVGTSQLCCLHRKGAAHHFHVAAHVSTDQQSCIAGHAPVPDVQGVKLPDGNIAWGAV